MKRMRKVIDELLEDDFTPGQVLRGLRIEKAVSQEGLSSITGIQRSAISALENDRIEMTSHYADIFSVVFKVPPYKVLYPNGELKKSKDLKKIEKRADAYFKRSRIIA
jgi:transcriptional regulator with XRE-family HTH domain